MNAPVAHAQSVDLPIKVLDESCMPKYATDGSVGFDLVAREDFVLTADCLPTKVPTGICVAVPEGYELQIRSRSGCASEGIIVANQPGTIDQDYRGEIKVLLELHSGAHPQTKHFVKGYRIAQAVLVPVTKANFVNVTELDPTLRADCGFGSTGV